MIKNLTIQSKQLNLAFWWVFLIRSTAEQLAAIKTLKIEYNY